MDQPRAGSQAEKEEAQTGRAILQFALSENSEVPRTGDSTKYLSGLLTNNDDSIGSASLGSLGITGGTAKRLKN